MNGVKKYGFVTAGHAVSEGDYIFKGINTTNYVQIGQCLTSINSADRRFDAAFIEAINGYYSDLSSSFTTNNGNRVTSTTTTSIAQNGVVYMCGCRSNEKSGIVLASTFAVSAGTTVFYSDVVLASYSCIPGDSGGLIYELEGNTANPAGIQTFMITADTLTGWGLSYSISPYYYGGGYYYSGYCKIGNVLNGIGVSIVA